jgi:hypothetical protein
VRLSRLYLSKCVHHQFLSEPISAWRTSLAIVESLLRVVCNYLFDILVLMVVVIDAAQYVSFCVSSK